MDVTAALLSVAVTVGSMVPAGAIDPAAPSAGPIETASMTAPDDRMPDVTGQTPSLRQVSMTPAPQQRPAALVPLYASFAALQVFDVYSTSRSVARGGQELNPVMAPVAGKSAASAAVKAAATAGSIYFVEKAWKQNRKGAVILMTALNVVTAAVVAHNTRVARK